jgi:hypothetical protein
MAGVGPTPDGQDKSNCRSKSRLSTAARIGTFSLDRRRRRKGAGTRACDAGYEEAHTPGGRRPWSTWGVAISSRGCLLTAAWRSVQRQAFAITYGARRRFIPSRSRQRTGCQTSSVPCCNSSRRGAVRFPDRRGVRNPARKSTVRSPEERRLWDHARKHCAHRTRTIPAPTDAWSRWRLAYPVEPAYPISEYVDDLRWNRRLRTVDAPTRRDRTLLRYPHSLAALHGVSPTESRGWSRAFVCWCLDEPLGRFTVWASNMSCSSCACISSRDRCRHAGLSASHAHVRAPVLPNRSINGATVFCASDAAARRAAAQTNNERVLRKGISFRRFMLDPRIRYERTEDRAIARDEKCREPTFGNDVRQLQIDADNRRMARTHPHCECARLLASGMCIKDASLTA